MYIDNITSIYKLYNEVFNSYVRSYVASWLLEFSENVKFH